MPLHHVLFLFLFFFVLFAHMYALPPSRHVAVFFPPAVCQLGFAPFCFVGGMVARPFEEDFLTLLSLTNQALL